MPGFDATGPQGQGAMTGWGQGCCGGDAQGVPRTAMGRGGGRNRGGSQGRRCGFGRGRGGFQGRRGNVPASSGAAPSSAAVAEVSAVDLETLKSEVQACAQTLERINARIMANPSPTPMA